MSTPRKHRPEQGPPPADKPVAPTHIGYGHPEYNFVQSVIELQKSITRVETVLEQVQRTSDETKAKVSRFEKIMYASGVVLVIALGVGGWMLNAAKEFALLHYKTALESQLRQPHQPVQLQQEKKQNQR